MLEKEKKPEIAVSGFRTELRLIRWLEVHANHNANSNEFQGWISCYLFWSYAVIAIFTFTSAGPVGEARPIALKIAG